MRRTSRRFTFLFAALMLVLGLVLVPAADGVGIPMPTPGGNIPVSNWQMCAPGQQNCFDRLDKYRMSCVYNDDSTNSNVAFGLRLVNNPQKYYQILLQRRWIWCADAEYAKVYAVILGPGYCMRWIRTLTVIHFDAGGVNQSYSLFDLGAGMGYRQGSAIQNHEFYLNRSPANHYVISQYLC